jgi:hypothetical protein
MHAVFSPGTLAQSMIYPAQSINLGKAQKDSTKAQAQSTKAHQVRPSKLAT